MERTKETLEARVRETPLVDRLKECQKRIGNMCAELRGPKMSIPVEYYDDDFYICTTLADAQATIAALQAIIKQMGEQACVLAKDGMTAKAQVEALQAQVARAKESCRCYSNWWDGKIPERPSYEALQQQVEALQAEKLMLERGVSAQSALIDGLQSQLIKRTADLEAVQHERDEANSHVKFLGATKQANGSFCLDMKKYHARHRCGRHRDDPWKGIDTEIDCFVCLKHALDAEREKVAFLEKKNANLVEASNLVLKVKADQDKRISTMQTKLTQLQALVRALPVLPESDLHLDEVWARLKRGNIGIDLVLNLLRYRATLDATTPAPDTSIIGKCEPPSQWDPNAQVRGDIS